MAYIILSTKDLQINPLRSLSEWWTSTFDLSRITPLGPPILATLVSPLTASNLEGESSWVQSVMGVLRWRERNSNRNNTSANSTGSPTPHTSLDMQVKLPPAISFVKSCSSIYLLSFGVLWMCRVSICFRCIIMRLKDICIDSPSRDLFEVCQYQCLTKITMTDEIISMCIMYVYKPMHIPIKTSDIFQVSLDIQCHCVMIFLLSIINNSHALISS